MLIPRFLAHLPMPSSGCSFQYRTASFLNSSVYCVAVRNELCSTPNLMDDTLLNLCFWVDCFDCLWKFCKTIYAGYQDIPYTTFFYYLKLTVILAHIHTKHILMPIHIDSSCDIDSPFNDTSLIPYMIMACFHKNNSIDIF